MSESLGRSILNTSRRLVSNINNSLEEFGIDVTFDQLDVLMHLNNNLNNAFIQNDIADDLGKSKSGILRTIDILEKKGYVARKISKNDRRKNLIVITTKGREVTNRACVEMRKIEAELIEGIDLKDIQKCKKVLNCIFVKISI